MGTVFVIDHVFVFITFYMNAAVRFMPAVICGFDLVRIEGNKDIIQVDTQHKIPMCSPHTVGHLASLCKPLISIVPLELCCVGV